MNRVLLVDASFSAVPIYRALERSGHEVWVVSKRREDPLVTIAGERWLEADYSDVGALLKVATPIGFDYAVPGCTDVSMKSLIETGLAGPRVDSLEVNEILNDKERFRALCEELGLSAPTRVCRSDFPLAGKFICKPVDGYSGKGITVFDGLDLEALELATQTAEQSSATSRYLIEEFVEGQLISFSAFIEQAEVRDYLLVKEGGRDGSYAVDTSYLIDAIPPAAMTQVKSGVEQISRRLELVDGLLHTQFLLSGENAYVIEVTRRCPGDLYSMLVEFSTGFPYAAKYASYFTGTVVSAPPLRRRLVLRHTVAKTKRSVPDGLVLNTPLEVFAYFQAHSQNLHAGEEAMTRMGVMFIEARDEVALRSLYSDLVHRSLYDDDRMR